MPKRRAARATQYQTREFRDLQARISANIRRLRAEREWTQGVAAERCEMLEQHYFRIEAGALNVTLTTLARLCRGFRIDPAELFAPAGPRARRAPRAKT